MKAQDAILGEKDYLTITEAKQYWNLSNRKFYEFLKKGPYRFLVQYHTRTLIVRVEFEKYLRKYPQIKEELTNGKPRAGKKRLEA